MTLFIPSYRSTITLATDTDSNTFVTGEGVQKCKYLCSSMRRSKGGGEVGSPDPPGKAQIIWVTIEISIWKKFAPLKPWKSIVFSAIKPLINNWAPDMLMT